MTIHHAKALGIGVAVLFAASSTPAQGQTIPSNVARPLGAAANLLSGGQVGTPTYPAPYGYTTPTPYGSTTAASPTQAVPVAPSYYYYAPGNVGQAAVAPTYVTPGQAGYPTNYYQSGYSGYVQQPQATRYVYPQATRTNPVVNAVRSVIQPQRYVYPTYAAPGYAPTYVVPR